jgi:hypothetical protein
MSNGGCAARGPVIDWVLGEWALEGMSVIGRVDGLVFAVSAVGFHCIQPNLRQPAEFTG